MGQPRQTSRLLRFLLLNLIIDTVIREFIPSRRSRPPDYNYGHGACCRSFSSRAGHFVTQISPINSGMLCMRSITLAAAFEVN